MKHLRIGTRGSILAKWQAEFVRNQIFQTTGVEGEIIIIKTTGDKLQQSSLSQIGGKGIFIKELEDALLEESIDIAVHSVKDFHASTERVVVSRHLPREDVRDCSRFRKWRDARQPSPKCTRRHGQPPRQAQLRHARPDLDVRDLRGNVDTRLRKVEAGEYDAVMLAKAGLDRLGWAHRISETLSPDVCMPAVGQGALGIECRASDAETSDALENLNDAETRAAIVAERTVLSVLQGGCQVRWVPGRASRGTNSFLRPASARSMVSNMSSSAPLLRPTKRGPLASGWRSS